MRKLLSISLASFLLSISLNAQEVVSYPFNPDSDGDTQVATGDFLETLSVFGAEFQPAEILVDGTSLSEYLTVLSSQVQLLSDQYVQIASMQQTIDSLTQVVEVLSSQSVPQSLLDISDYVSLNTDFGAPEVVFSSGFKALGSISLGNPWDGVTIYGEVVDINADGGFNVNGEEVAALPSNLSDLSAVLDVVNLGQGPEVVFNSAFKVLGSVNLGNPAEDVNIYGWEVNVSSETGFIVNGTQVGQ